MQDAYRHCEALVREADRDRYLAALFAPATARRHLLALYAFNVELSLVGDRARDALAGEARLQWWREAVSGNAGAGGAANPVASALLETVAQFGPSRVRLVQMIEARMFDLHTEPMPTMQALNAYLNETAAAVFSFAAEIAGVKAEAAALEAGIAYGMTQLLRNFPYHASRHKIFLPLDVLEKHGVDADEILQGKNSAALSAALLELREIARRRLEAAEREIEKLERKVRPSFLVMGLVEPYLSLMDRPDFDPFRTPVEIPQWRRQWTLWRAARRS